MLNQSNIVRDECMLAIIFMATSRPEHSAGRCARVPDRPGRTPCPRADEVDEWRGDKCSVWTRPGRARTPRRASCGRRATSACCCARTERMYKLAWPAGGRPPRVQTICYRAAAAHVRSTHLGHFCRGRLISTLTRGLLLILSNF